MAVEGYEPPLARLSSEGSAQDREFGGRFVPGASGPVAGALAWRAGLFETFGFFGEPCGPVEEAGVGTFVFLNGCRGLFFEVWMDLWRFPPGSGAEPRRKASEQPSGPFPRGET